MTTKRDITNLFFLNIKDKKVCKYTIKISIRHDFCHITKSHNYLNETIATRDLVWTQQTHFYSHNVYL